MPKFNYSAKAQTVNPKKVYCIDTGMIQNVTLSVNFDMGRMFENAVQVCYEYLKAELLKKLETK